MQFTSNKQIKMLIATIIGSILEIFDFLIFIFLSPIIANLFFPHHIHFLAILFTYCTIAISYLLRPIGGLIFGSISDRYGRKTVFMLSILLMSIPSLLISILPTFNQVSYLAPALLICLRIVQGFSLGAEVPGSITYVAEKFNHTNFYFYLSFLTFGANIGVACAALFIESMEQYTSHSFMYTYGWRIPFIIGGVLAIVGVYIRMSVTESEEFIHLQKIKQISQSPLVTLLKNHKKQIFLGVMLALIVSITTSVFHVILPELLESYRHIALQNSMNISIIGALILAVCSLIAAYFTNYCSPIFLVRLGLCGLLIIFSYSTYYIHFYHVYSLYDIYILVALTSIALSFINGVFFGILAHLFKTQVRFSGVAICYNIAYILGAGLAPVWTSLIMQLSNNFAIIIVVCLIITIITLLTTPYIPSGKIDKL